MDKKTVVVSLLFFVGMSMLFIGVFKSSLAQVKSDIPLVNDAWYDALKAIKEDSENNPGQPWEKAIITSWWDFGHHFKYLSDRAVTFDGGTQVTPQAHWVGKLFLSSDEDVSVSILRMLDCGGNKAFDSLTNVSDTPFAIDSLNKWFKKEFRTDDFNPSTIKYLNCNPTSAYVIASEDMVGKAGVWGHFGSWDFNRADMWVNVKKMTREQGISYMVSHNYTKTYNESQQLWTQLQTMTESEANNWIAPWPGYAGISDCVAQNSSIVCNDGVIITDGDITLSDGRKPQSFVYVKEGKIVEKKYPNATLGYSIALTPDNKLVLASPELINSLFTKLFFFNGVGLKHFKLLKETQNIDGFKIKVFKVDWQ